MRSELTRADIESLLDELDHAMTEAEVTGTIELVGGAAMALVHYDRIGTTDVDAAIHPSSEIIALADAVGARNGLRAGWLNNLAQGFIPPGDTGDAPELVRRGQSLTVTVAGALGARSITQADGETLELAPVVAVEPSVCGRWVLRLDRRCGLPSDHTGDCR